MSGHSCCVPDPDLDQRWVGGRLSSSFMSFSISACESVSVSCRHSGAVLMLWVGVSVDSGWLVDLDLGELVLGVVESGLFSLSGEVSGECLFAVSSMILFCILGLIMGLGCPREGMRGVSPLGLGLGWL